MPLISEAGDRPYKDFMRILSNCLGSVHNKERLVHLERGDIDWCHLCLPGSQEKARSRVKMWSVNYFIIYSHALKKDLKHL